MFDTNQLLRKNLENIKKNNNIRQRIKSEIVVLGQKIVSLTVELQQKNQLINKSGPTIKSLIILFNNNDDLQKNQ